MNMNKCNLVWFLLMVIVMGACSEDEFQEEYGESKVENLGTQRLATFLLPYYSSPDLEDENAHIIQIGGGYAQSHKADVLSSSDGKTSLVRLILSGQERMPNGNYIISFRSIPYRFLAQVNNERIGISRMNAPLKSELSGEGTEANPYKIGNSVHFNKFIKMLKEDALNCAGVFFKQTSSFNWENDESNMGEGLSSQVFAGHYDGGNKIINGLTINGKTNAGIFTKLTNGATVKNLSIQNLKFVNGSNMGAIAGVAEGTVTLRNIKVFGEISGTNNIGGLVGVANGTLNVNTVTLGLSVSGTENVGGIVGLVQNNKGKLVLKNADVSDSFVVGDLQQKALAATNVGGFAGNVDNASFEIDSSTVIHTGSASDNTIVVSGKTNVGGVIGKISSLSANSSINKTKVISPILVDTYGGGFVGWAKLANKLSVSGCQYGGIMKQGSYIGGFFGLLDCSGKEWLSYSDNDVVASNGSDIYIGGSNYVGGVFGQLNAATVSLAGENHFATEINGMDYVGGIVGSMDKTTMDIGSPQYLNNGNKTVGLYISGNNYVGGAAGYMESSTLKSGHTFNLTAAIPDSLSVKYKIICTTKANGNNVGGAVGRACKSVIKGITVKSTITNKAESGKYTGGVVGFFDNGNKSVEHCAFLGILTGKEYTGGIVGEINKLGQIKQCVNYGNINGANRTGGIVGKVNYVDDEPWVNECVNVGPVTASHFVGGIAGYISADGNEGKDWIKVARCGNYGTIIASSSDGGCVGGLVGKCDTDKIRVNNGANHGTIIGKGAFKGIGGIAGSLGDDADVLTEWDNVHVYECVNTAAVYSDKTKKCHIGGIVGYLEEGDEGSDDTNSQVNDCYNCGPIGPTSEATHGGIIGHCDYYTSLRRCINYGDTGDKGESMIGTVVDAGIVHDSNLYHLEGTGDDDGRNWSSTPFTEDKMRELSTFIGFSADTWKIGVQTHLRDNKKRAILKDCPFQNLLYN